MAPETQETPKFNPETFYDEWFKKLSDAPKITAPKDRIKIHQTLDGERVSKIPNLSDDDISWAVNAILENPEDRGTILDIIYRGLNIICRDFCTNSDITHWFALNVMGYIILEMARRLDMSGKTADTRTKVSETAQSTGAEIGAVTGTPTRL
ncbi:hypothetical protein HZC21_06180 [Candidatus Peregrinibacteria bacterium]|nr:hypothetical protein [Candidatus Peregrinibacteria bacterium]